MEVSEKPISGTVRVRIQKVNFEIRKTSIRRFMVYAVHAGHMKPVARFKSKRQASAWVKRKVAIYERQGRDFETNS